MKVAVCGVWHVHAGDYTKTAQNTANVEVIGFYEENDDFAAAFAETYGLPRFSSLQALLESDADAVIVCSASNVHADQMVQIARAKKHIFTEKVLALSTEDCLRVKQAVEENGVRFVISFVHKFAAGIRAVKALADSGELGKLNFVRFRNCHNGSTGNWLPNHFYSLEQCGGGAMIDLGAHGMYLIDWFLGMPQRYQSAFTVWDQNEKNADRLEDNAVTVMTYADGSVAINETGFVSVGSPMVLEVGGACGYARFCDGSVEKRTVQTGYQPVSVEADAEYPSPLQQFLAGQVNEDCGMDAAVRLTQMMEGAYQTR